MGYHIYAGSSVCLPQDFKKIFPGSIEVTDDFSAAVETGAAIILSLSDSGETVSALKASGYPVILQIPESYSGESGTGNPGLVDRIKKETGLNAFFCLAKNSPPFYFSQALSGYLDYLKQYEREKHYRKGFERQEKLNREFLKVGIALSAERNNSKLLDYIMAKTREITKADAGSLYLLDPDKKNNTVSMIFKIAHNDSNPTDFSEFRMPVQKKSIAGYVAITGEVVKFDDAYSIPESAEYSFNKSFDESTGYRTKSMLTVPMKNHKDRIIGVIQLINKKKERSVMLKDSDIVDKNVIPFSRDDEEIVLALSSLAAVSLDNNQLYHEIEELFECLVKASAKAIEQRDPATSGHSSRVALYTVALAEAVSGDEEVYKGITFTEEHLKGLRYACLLHDFGKVGVRENVLVKAKKLYPGMLEQIISRLDIICANIRINSLEQILSLDPSDPDYQSKTVEIRNYEKQELARIERYREAVIQSNETSVLDSDPGVILEEIRHDKRHSYITDSEYEYLSIKRGSLTQKEREEIMSHASHTYDFLKNIPWPENMEWIPETAKWHHEALDGSGYPDGMKGDELPLESRLMAVADIFDALTASDRPYKKSVPVEKALKILGEEAARGKLDRDAVALFIKNRIYSLVGQAPEG